MKQQSWYNTLRQIASLGSTSARPGSLAGLHEARKEHLSQFFTPDQLAGFVWRLVEPVMTRRLAERPDSVIYLLDNSVGSGRLLQFADPNTHGLAGIDIHAESINALADTAEAAGFEHEFKAAGLEEVSPRHYDIGLINPPFSIRLDSPLLEPYPCTTWGTFGPNTSAISHAYALYQALEACPIVAAILPASYAGEVAKDPDLSPRLRAIFKLPRGTFREENTEVDTCVLLFDEDEEGAPAQRFTIANLQDKAPDLGLSLPRGYHRGPARLRFKGIEATEPTITLPVTGDRKVRLVHNQRRIGLRFACGLTQAKVENAVQRERIGAYQSDGIAHHRYSKQVRYTGQGLLDIEAHLAQPDPLVSFDGLLSVIREAGGNPEVDPSLRGYLRRRVREVRREATPFRHVVYVPNGAPGDAATLTACARKTFLVNPNVWGSPVIQCKDRLTFERLEEAGRVMYRADLRGQPYTLSADELYKLFEVEGEQEEGAGWQVAHEGLRHHFPAQAAALTALARIKGIEQWLWEYQLEDLVELTMSPKGAVVAWEMGLGKARLASALIKLRDCKHGLIVVQAGLVPEMIKELKGLPIAAEDWQVIKSPGDLISLRQINIISYERLRRPLAKGKRTTYAHRLRRRIGVMVADEGHLLSNPGSDQSRALWRVSAKHRYILTGTPIANYPRDALPLVTLACGDGTAAQPYGYYRSYMSSQQATSMAYVPRGIDKFREDFVTLEWVTNEFAEDLRTGAKREIPKIANLDAYRKALAPHIKRRVAKEPEVAKYINIPDPTIKVESVEWDQGHLDFYRHTAESFVQWYQEQQRKAGRTNTNLIAILARIQAVCVASNYPQKGIEGFGYHLPLTSKQRKALDMLEDLTAKGHKTILYAKNPGVLELLHRELTTRGLDSMTYHGSKNVAQRTLELDRRFREGDCPILLASVGVTQAGLNLYQADRVIFLDRDWAWKTEYQAMRRVLRPQQKRDVVVHYLHLLGGIDEYQAQMVDFKRDAVNTGLDWATPEMDDVEFAHIDTILGRFIEGLKDLSASDGKRDAA